MKRGNGRDKQRKLVNKVKGRHRRPSAGGKDVWARLRTALLVFQIAGAIILSAAVAAGVGTIRSVSASLPANPRIHDFPAKYATEIYAATGELLGKVWE